MVACGFFHKKVGPSAISHIMTDQELRWTVTIETEPISVADPGDQMHYTQGMPINVSALDIRNSFHVFREMTEITSRYSTACLMAVQKKGVGQMLVM